LIATDRDEVDEQSSRKALTVREQDVLNLLAQGFDNRLIARELSISYATVRTHIQHILAKLDAHSKLEAAAQAHRISGWSETSPSTPEKN
jgi:DNA-binding NarL/FixJ family response regulator